MYQWPQHPFKGGFDSFLVVLTASVDLMATSTTDSRPSAAARTPRRCTRRPRCCLARRRCSASLYSPSSLLPHFSAPPPHPLCSALPGTAGSLAPRVHRPSPAAGPSAFSCDLWPLLLHNRVFAASVIRCRFMARTWQRADRGNGSVSTNY